MELDNFSPNAYQNPITAPKPATGADLKPGKAAFAPSPNPQYLPEPKFADWKRGKAQDGSRGAIFPVS
jgi:hypothetical protein